MFDAGALVFNIRASGTQVFQQELQRADKAVEGFGKSSQSAADKTEQLGKNQDKTTEQTRKHQKAQEDAARKAADYSAAQEKVGKVLVTAGAALVATTALTVRSAIQWESAWAGVTKTVDGTAEELAEVQGGLRGLTKELPASHTEIAAVAEAAGQLGVQTGSVVAFTRTMIDLGETTNLSANDAATALARFMNVMGTSQDKVSNLGSSVVALGNNYATTEAEIVSMATRLSGAARQVGLTEGETMGLATALSSVGIEAEAGGSAVSKVMIDIAASVDEGGDRVKQFADIAGMSADEFSAKWKTNPGAALAAFVKGLANAEAQGKSTIGMLTDLGITEVRMRDALLRSAAASDQFTKAMDLGNNAFEENNALQAEAAKRYETVESQLGIMRNRINDAAIDMGSVFLPTVAAVAGAVGDFADGLASLPAPVKEAVAVGGLLVGVVALLGGTALIAIPKIVEFRLALQTLATTTSPATVAGLKSVTGFLMGPWGVAFVAAAAGVVALEKYLDSLRATSEEMSNALVTAKDAKTIFDTAMKGREVTAFTSIQYEIEDLDQVLRTAARQAERWWERIGNDDNFAAERALEQIGEELASLAGTDLPAAQRAFSLLAEQTDGSQEQLWRLLSVMPAYRDALIEQATAQGIQIEGLSDAERKTRLLEIAQSQGEEQSESAAQAYIAAADGADALRKDLDQLLDVLNEANEVGQDAISANIDYEQSLADAAKRIEEIRAGTEGYASTLDITTQAGRENKDELIRQAEASQKAARATFDLDGDTAAYIERLKEGRQRLIDNAIAMGASAGEAEELANKIYRIPTEREVKILADTSRAQAQIDSYIYQNSGREIIVKIGTSRVAQGAGGSGGITQADGGVIESYADGGVRENHVAQMARAGAWRVWAEPETGGESYIPHAVSKRARSEAIMAETAAILGGVYIPAGAAQYADGSPARGSSDTAVAAILDRIAAQPDGPAVFNLYDADGALIARMRGEAAQVTKTAGSWARRGRRR